MLEDEHGNFHLKNLSMHPAESEEDALNLLFMGDTNRCVCACVCIYVYTVSVCVCLCTLTNPAPSHHHTHQLQGHRGDADE